MDGIITEIEKDTANTKDQRWAKQFGDFAEQLVMYVLGRCKNMSVALVDHVGADVFAVSRADHSKRFAVSVKGRIIPKSESMNFVFDMDNMKKLKETADVFGMEPALALVLVDEQEGKRKIRLFFFTMENIDILCRNEEAEFVKYTDKGEISFKITESRKMHYLTKHFKEDGAGRWADYIDYTELTFDELTKGVSFLQ